MNNDLPTALLVEDGWTPTARLAAAEAAVETVGAVAAAGASAEAAPRRVAATR